MTTPTTLTQLKPGDVIQAGDFYAECSWSRTMHETQRIGAIVVEGDEYFRPVKETKPTEQTK